MTGDAPSVFGGRAGIHDLDVARPMLDMAKRAATRAAPAVGGMGGVGGYAHRERRHLLFSATTRANGCSTFVLRHPSPSAVRRQRSL